jgi:hypothetical protein
MANPNSNAFNSSVIGIYLEDSDSSETGANPKFSYNILQKNPECEFHRLELEENIFEIYPVGSLIVRDTKDIVSFIANNNVKSIRLQFQDKSFLSLSVTSTSYVNNAASNTEENYVSVNVSNCIL